LSSVITYALFLACVSIIFFVLHRIRITKIKREDEILKRDFKEQNSALHSINTKLEAAKKETDAILYNADEGFLLLNPEFKVKAQYTRSLETMLETDQIAGRPLIELIQDFVDDEIVSSSTDFLELIFNPELDEEMLLELNPMDMLELEIGTSREKTPVSRFLTFNFRRIMNGSNNIAELFIEVKDVTDRINLTKKLENSEAEQKRKMELMFGILHVEPELFAEFLSTFENEAQYIRKELSEKADEERLQAIHRSVHSVKGNASLLDLQAVVEKSHQFENLLMNVLKSNNFSEEVIPEIRNRFEDLELIYLELKDMLSVIKNFQTNFRPKRRYENKILIESLEKLVKNTAKSLDKSVQFDHNQFDPGSIPYKFRLLVKEILIQLVRNSISHGIELPEARTIMGKPEEGLISLSSELTTDFYTFRLRDDGQGIKLEKLKHKIIDSGKWIKKDIDKWDDEELLYKIFEPGISTHDSSDYISGRGMGMDIIKYKLSNSGGTIIISHEPGSFCEFKISLPLSNDKTN